MKRSTIATAIFVAILGITLIVGSIITWAKGDDAFKLAKSFEPITKVEITVISAPHIDEKGEKKVIIISDRVVLDSLSSSLRNLKNSIRVDIAKLNSVYVIMDVYKGNQKATMEVVNSEYTGWVLVIGDSKFKNDYVFRLVQRYFLK